MSYDISKVTVTIDGKIFPLSSGFQEEPEIELTYPSKCTIYDDHEDIYWFEFEFGFLTGTFGVYKEKFIERFGIPKIGDKFDLKVVTKEIVGE